MLTEGETSYINCSRHDLGHTAVFLEMHVEMGNSTATPAVTAPPTSPQTDSPNTLSNKDEAIHVQFSLKANYDDFINESTRTDIIEQIRSDIAAKLNISKLRIANLTVARGSIIVSFTLLPGDHGERNTSSLASLLESQVRSDSLVITLSDGRQLKADSSSFVLVVPTVPTPTPTTAAPKAASPDSTGLSSGALVGIIVGSVLAVAMGVGIVFCLKKKTQRAKVDTKDDECVHLRDVHRETSPAQGELLWIWEIVY